MPRTALVTGGASGLGAASAARLRAEGLTVTTLDVSGPADVTADVTDEAALRQVAGRIGPVDVLVNSAGIVGANKPLLETTARGVAARPGHQRAGHGEHHAGLRARHARAGAGAGW